MTSSELIVKALAKLNEEIIEEVKRENPTEEAAEAILAKNRVPDFGRGVLSDSNEDS